MAGWKSRDSVPMLVKDYLAGRLKVDEFVTHTMPMGKINDAFDLMHHGQRSAMALVVFLACPRITPKIMPLKEIDLTGGNGAS